MSSIKNVQFPPFSSFLVLNKSKMAAKDGHHRDVTGPFCRAHHRYLPMENYLFEIKKHNKNPRGSFTLPPYTTTGV